MESESGAALDPPPRPAPWPPPRPAPWPLFLSAALLTVLALLFGGASRENAIQVAGLEFAALPVLVMALWRLARGRERPPGALAVAGLILMTSAVPAIQLLPLPASLWTALPQRGQIADILAAAGLPPGARPISLTPMLTLRHLLALIPPAAMAFACIQMDALQKRRLAFLWTGGALVGLFIGVAQLAMGPDSGLYFYATTNLGSSVGLFSNRNHHASLLLGAMPLAAALALTTPHGAGRGSRQLLGLLAVLLMAAAVVAVQSRAAVLLLAPVLLGMMAVAWRLMAGRRVSGRPAVVALLGAAAALAAVVTLSPGLSRFTSSPAEDARFAAWPAVFAAMGEHQPLGAGFGAFDTAYRAAEPLEQVSPIYLNHAHNDYLELALEAGWLAAAALAVFVVWFVRRGVAIWRATGPSQGGLAATAWIAAATALAHSAVDYPLRTLTMATFFAFCCAVVASAATKPQTGD